MQDDETQYDDDLNTTADRADRARKRAEAPIRDVIRRAVEKGVEAGVGTLTRADSALRGVMEDGKLPKEVVSYVFSSIDDTKNALVRGVAKEVRDFLEATDVAGEFYRALTSLSFEVKTEIRFIPNEAGGVRPQVKASATPKSKRKGTKASAKTTSVKDVDKPQGD